MNRGDISNLLRKAGLIFFTDFLRFQVHRLKNRSVNRYFRKKNPSIKIPPDYLLYESFALDYPAYIEGGRDSARSILSWLSKHMPREGLNILDWGCGPGRIVRHMPELFDKSCKFYGTDYNARSIRWCSQNIPGIEFSKNGLSPPLGYPDEFFNLVYGISILTHFSEAMHHAWVKELNRVLGKDGILLVTTAGNAFKTKLTRKEKSRFEQGELIIRGKVKEGHRTFTAFHPARFIRGLFSDFTILEHIERAPVNQDIPQDVWIFKKGSGKRQA